MKTSSPAARLRRSERSDAELMRALADGEIGPLGELYDLSLIHI